MPVKVKIWDAEGGDDGKGGMVEMFSLHAGEALKNDPKRYAKAKPGTEPKEVRQERARIEADETVIPDNWQELPWQERRKLAVELGADRNVNQDIANGIIAAAAKRQSKAPPAPVPPPGAE